MWFGDTIKFVHELLLLGHYCACCIWMAVCVYVCTVRVSSQVPAHTHTHTHTQMQWSDVYSARENDFITEEITLCSGLWLQLALRQVGTTASAKHCCPHTGLFERSQCETFICFSNASLFPYLLLFGEKVSCGRLSVSTNQNPSCESNILSAIQKTPSILWSSKVRTVFAKPTLAFILSQMNPFNSISTHFFMIPFNIIVPPTSRCWKWSLSFRFPHCNLFLFPIRATCLLDLLTLMISADWWKSGSFAVLNFLQSPVLSF